MTANTAINDLFLEWFSLSDTEVFVRHTLNQYVSSTSSPPATPSTSPPTPTNPNINHSNGHSHTHAHSSSPSSPPSAPLKHTTSSPSTSSPPSPPPRASSASPPGRPSSPPRSPRSPIARSPASSPSSSPLPHNRQLLQQRLSNELVVNSLAHPEAEPPVFFGTSPPHSPESRSPVSSPPHLARLIHNNGPNSPGSPGSPRSPGSPQSPLADLARKRRLRLPQLSHLARSPPRSPRTPHSGRRSRRNSSSVDDQHRGIKQFYFPQGVPTSPNTRARENALIRKIFTPHYHRAQGSASSPPLQPSTVTPSSTPPARPPDPHVNVPSIPLSAAQLTIDQFMPVTTLVCGLSSFCNAMLFTRLDPDETGFVSMETFVKYWRREIQPFDVPERLVNVLQPLDYDDSDEENTSTTADSPKRRRARTVLPTERRTRLGSRYLTREDFVPLIEDVVNRHPGLEFLEATPEFQFRYVQTVIARIFYTLSRIGSERVTPGEIRRSNFCETLALLDEEQDINKINDYFSYEHFYVIYCKFWELDTDHDFIIDTNDLLRYDDYALTPQIIERIVSGIPRTLSSGTPGLLNYDDFIVFFISEVNKHSDVSIEYWFRCVDLDGDGVISLYELEHFFLEQQRRIEAVTHEAVRIEDIICQLTDMIKPSHEGRFTRKDLKRSRMAPLFFNMLFNMKRYAIAEQRDPFLAQQVHDTPELSDWDRYAISEYFRLAEVDQAQEEMELDLDLDPDEMGSPWTWDSTCAWKSSSLSSSSNSTSSNSNFTAALTRRTTTTTPTHKHYIVLALPTTFAASSSSSSPADSASSSRRNARTSSAPRCGPGCG